MGNFCHLQDGYSALLRFAKFEFYPGRVIFREFLLLHFFKHVDAALYLRCLCVLCPEPLYKTLHFFDLFLLVGVARRLESLPVFLFDFIEGIVSAVLGDGAPFQFPYLGGVPVEKCPVVRDKDQPPFEFLEVRFEPEDGIYIKVVCRFIQKEQVRFLKEQAGKCNAHLPAAAQFADGFCKVGVPEPHALQHLARLRIYFGAVDYVQLVLQVGIAVKQQLVILSVQ